MSSLLIMYLKHILILITHLVIIIISLSGSFYLIMNLQIPVAKTPTPVAQASLPTKTLRSVTVSKYISENLATLSPVKTQEGQSFSVSKIMLTAATGTVEYSDGKGTYTADFTYSLDDTGKTSVQSFTVRE